MHAPSHVAATSSSHRILIMLPLCIPHAIVYCRARLRCRTWLCGTELTWTRS